MSFGEEVSTRSRLDLSNHTDFPNFMNYFHFISIFEKCFKYFLRKKSRKDWFLRYKMSSVPNKTDHKSLQFVDSLRLYANHKGL